MSQSHSIFHITQTRSAPISLQPAGASPGALRAVFVDANPTLGDVAQRLLRPGDLALTINRAPDIRSEALPALLAGAQIAVIDHTHLPTVVAGDCAGLKYVVFLGTGACSYINPEGLAEAGIEVHTIKGYGDTAAADWPHDRPARFGPSAPRGPGCVHCRAAAERPRIDHAAERDAVGALGVPHRRGQRQPDRCGTGPLPAHRRALLLNIVPGPTGNPT